ncbi:DUF3551 domain-containing protein [Bradyrhizobium sp.]|uniref:DUF3551 domain-containing protein n=1 Tax=Bradyrhizobium sp. TaxID=376 RepID=UPI003C4AAF37
MRVLALVTLTIGTLAMATPAPAQTFNPNYPVCLHVFDQGDVYYECRYNSLAQCNATASGRSAECQINPYFAADAYPPPPVVHHRRHHHHVS